MSEQQAAEALHLDPNVVSVLEADDFAALGAPVFVKGHLRRYAALLGLPDEDIVGAYEHSKQQVCEPTLVPRARLEMEPVRGRPRWPWVVGGTAAFLVAAFLAAYVSEHGLPGLQVPADEADTENAPDQGGSTASGVDGLPGSASAPSGDRSNTLPVSGQATLATNNVQGSARAGTGGQGTSAPSGDRGAAPVPGPGQVSLQLRFTADSWVEILDGSGKAVVYDLDKAGTERTITATAPLSVTLGNAPGVAISVNGRSQPTPRLADGGALARFHIGADGTVH
jgi:cytoskeleton protein RodZ